MSRCSRWWIVRRRSAKRWALGPLPQVSAVAAAPAPALDAATAWGPGPRQLLLDCCAHWFAVFRSQSRLRQLLLSVPQQELLSAQVQVRVRARALVRAPALQ